MVELDIVYKGKVKNVGIFLFKDLYAYAYDWLRDENYDIFEKTYNETVTGETKKLEIRWEATREISDYFKYKIKANWMILNMKSIEVQKEGKKIKMDTGSVEVKFEAILMKDYEDRWENAPFWKFLRGIYEKFVIKSRIWMYEVRLMDEIEDFISQIKSFLALEGQRDIFHPKVSGYDHP